MSTSRESENIRFVVVAGPTGSGKSRLAEAIAKPFAGEIVGCDSVQLYRGFDIGSAKPSATERQTIPHHMIDILEWNEDYDAAAYAEEAGRVIGDIRERARLPVVVGGTGLYLRALLGETWSEDLPKDETLREKLQKETSDELHKRLEKVDEQRAAQLHPNDRFRVIRALELYELTGKPPSTLAPTAPRRRGDAYVIILDPPRKRLHERIEARAQKMLDAGLVEEVRGLLGAGVSREAKPMESIGYKQAVAYVEGELSEADLLPRIVVATRQYAKRQTTWFRKVPADLRLDQVDSQEVLRRLTQIPGITEFQRKGF